jgi:hypothetical protein
MATVIGTITGAYFGVHAGSSGRQSAEAGRARPKKLPGWHWPSWTLIFNQNRITHRHVSH